MKNLKKILSFVICICLLVFFIPVNVYAADTNTNGFTISGTTLKGYTGTGGAITVPSTVTEIASGAFKGNATITSVTIPSGVTTIGEGAFENCTALASVNIPGSVTTMGSGVFAGCTALSSATLQANLTRIPDKTFYGCKSLSSIAISSGIKTIGSAAFYGCNSLSTMAIPDGVTTLDSQAFAYCNSLTGVSIPSSCTSIATDAFLGDRSLTTINVATGNATYASDGGCLYNASYTKLLTVPAGKSSVALNSGTKIIGTGALSECTGITSLNIPSGCTTIETNAFNASSLKSVTIPESVTSIANQGQFSPDVIYGYTGSTAEKYSADNDYVFYPLDGTAASGTDDEEVNIKTGKSANVTDDSSDDSSKKNTSDSDKSDGDSSDANTVATGSDKDSKPSGTSTGTTSSASNSSSGSNISGAYATTTGASHSYDSTPKTADDSQIALAVVALLLVLGMIFLVLGFRKREED